MGRGVPNETVPFTAEFEVTGIELLGVILSKVRLLMEALTPYVIGVELLLVTA